MTKSIHQIDKQLSNPSTKLLTVNQFVVEHPFASNDGIRFLIFNSKNNGMAKAGVIKRIGRKVLIDEGKFFAWVESQNEGGRNV
jgi:hypothetical protein